MKNRLLINGTLNGSDYCIEVTWHMFCCLLPLHEVLLLAWI